MNVHCYSSAPVERRKIIPNKIRRGIGDVRFTLRQMLSVSDKARTHELRVLEPMPASHINIKDVDINDHYSSLVCYDLETYSPSSDSRTHISKSPGSRQRSSISGVRPRLAEGRRSGVKQRLGARGEGARRREDRVMVNCARSVGAGAQGY
jgi:hypothetical protein